MWEDLRYAIDPTIAAVSTLTIVFTAALLGIAHVLRKRAEQNRTVRS
jgi:putative spermidine/putrescine transport system permease protein